MINYCFLSEECYSELTSELTSKYSVIFVESHANCYKAVNKHADIQMIVIDSILFIDDKIKLKNVSLCDVDKKQIKIHKHCNIKLINSQLRNRYPLSVPFNGKYLEKIFIHNLNYTQKEVLDYLKDIDSELIHVNQGYTGCSLLMLNNRKGITADKGIYNSLSKKNFEILLINKGDIILESMDAGFIGGCCGVHDNIVYINGDLNFHSDGKKIRKFVNEADYQIYEVIGKPLKDIGSVIFWEGQYE